MKPISINIGIKGFVKMEAVNPDTGERRLLADWFPNLILNSGLEIMDQRSDWFDWCQVGTSDDAPDAGQTSLQGWLRGTGPLTIESTVTGAEIAAPFYGKKEKVFRFIPLTGINQIIKEVGVGWGSGDIDGTGVGDIISRALIVDITGTPIAPSWKVGELLDVTYQLRYYPPLVDVTGTHDFNGVTYNYILRAAAVTDTAHWAAGIGSAMGQVSNSSADWRAGDGDIGTIEEDGPPAGLFANCDNANQFNVSVAPQYTIGVSSTCGSTGWNLADPGDGDGPGIRSLRFRTTAGSYQIQFGEGAAATGLRIPKTTDFTMAIQYNLTWAEGTIP